MTFQFIDRITLEYIEEAKELFGDILKQVENGQRTTTIITVSLSDTGLRIFDVQLISEI